MKTVDLVAVNGHGPEGKDSGLLGREKHAKKKKEKTLRNHENKHSFLHNSASKTLSL